MSDRELLEAAAKAAGIVLDTTKPDEPSDPMSHARIWDRTEPVRVLFYSDHRDHPMCRKPNTPGNVEWNPLTDDGDALRLATKLEFTVMTANLGKPTGYSCVEYMDDCGRTEMHRNHNGDANAATRRAIVRAAAQMGKTDTTKGEPNAR